MDFADLKDFLDQKVHQYNTPTFIEADPIQIPHQFSKKEDIEIMGFIMATIAWGNRKSILTNGERLIKIMGNDPYNFVMDYQTPKNSLIPFVHRTFNAVDLDYFLRALQAIYQQYASLETLFSEHPEISGVKGRIVNFRTHFFDISHEKRSEKHISNPLKGASAKRLNMMLRWFVRNDKCGVDFGIWNTIPTADLYLPLDVHTGNIARKLGMMHRTQNDWTALEEVQSILKKLDSNDPVKYDFALFGLGAYENF